MKSILICEGKTDADFLQYYMRKVNLWEDGRATTFRPKGAIETFLLEAISQKDPYDKSIIEKGKEYVKEADPEKRYLKKRRHITKAEYEVFFAIRTTEGQFNDRRDILKGIPWEDYTNIQESFKEFAKI